MSCQATFLGEGSDVPLDAAIYSLSQNKIYGVRGQYVHQFNATTGGREATFRFVDSILFGESSIVEVNGILYVGTWRGVIDNSSNSEAPARDIFAIDPSLTSSLQLGLNVQLGNSVYSPSLRCDGFYNLVTDGTYIYGLRANSFGHIFKVDPTNIATYVQRNSQALIFPRSDMIWDSDYQTLWVAESDGPEIDAYYFDIGSLFPIPTSVANPTPGQVFGLTRVPSTQKIYAVTGTQSILKLNADEAVVTLPANYSTATWSTLAAILPIKSNPVRIKYNPGDGMLYVPNWVADSVSIINPATDTAEDVITGFDSPIDIVFTPTKVFAVQNSNKGLKEVSTA